MRYRPRIAFIFCPLLPGYIRLETMPFAEHIIRMFAAAGWHIDIFLWNENDHCKLIAFFPENIHYRYVRMYTTRGRTKLIELTLRFAQYTQYKCVFSVGTIGSYIGGIVSAASRCPYVFLADEFPSVWGQSSWWSSLERWGARRAAAIVTPSDEMHARLREELCLEAEKAFVTIRNTPEVTLPLTIMDWHKLFGIPNGKRIFILAGSIADWAQVPEILTSVSYWRADLVLLLHSRNGGELALQRQQYFHLHKPERVFWSFEPLSEELLHSLVNYCTASFALYRNNTTGIELIGTSSGKLMRSIACGTPVITSSFESLNFVTREGLGIQVAHPSEIPGAIDNLARNGESYRARCALFGMAEKSLREEAWHRIVELVRRTPNGADLSSAREPLRKS